MDYYDPRRRALRAVRQLLYPRECPFCGRVLGDVRDCPDCAVQLETLRRKPGIRLDPAQHYISNLAGAAALIFAGRRGDVDRLADALLKFVELQRPVVEGGGQAKAVFHQALFAGEIPGVHRVRPDRTGAGLR